MIAAQTPLREKLTQLERDAIDTSWDDVERLVYKQAWKFWRQYGGDVEEVLADAGSHFMRAYNTFDPTRGTLFTTWVGSVVFQRLRHERQRRDVQRERERGDYLLDERTAPVTSAPHVTALLSGDRLDDSESTVSDVRTRLDAKRLANLVVNATDDFADFMGSGKVGKRLLREYLATLGWTSKRFTTAMGYVRRVLSM